MSEVKLENLCQKVTNANNIGLYKNGISWTRVLTIHDDDFADLIRKAIYNYDEVCAKNYTLSAQLAAKDSAITKLRSALDKMITKSNGLSMWVRDETMSKNLFNYDEFLHDGLVFLYERQCEAEQALEQTKETGV